MKIDDGDYVIGHIDKLLCGNPPKQTMAIVGTADEVLNSFLSNPNLNREDNFELPQKEILSYDFTTHSTQAQSSNRYESASRLSRSLKEITNGVSI